MSERELETFVVLGVLLLFLLGACLCGYFDAQLMEMRL